MAPVGSGGARSASDCPFQLTPTVGPGVDPVTTASETPAVCVAAVETPVIVSANVPVAVVVAVVTVRIELPPAVTDAGANPPLAPAGNPATDRLTLWADPEVTWVLTVYVVLEPRTTAWLDGAALIEKSSSAVPAVTRSEERRVGKE